MLHPVPFNDVQFVNLVQSLESLHRSYTADKYFPDSVYQPVLKAMRKTLSSFKELLKNERRCVSSGIGHANRYPQRERFLQLCTALPSSVTALLMDNPETFAELIVKTRNYLTHLDPKYKGAAMTNLEIDIALFGLILLFQMTVLNKLGVSQRILEEAVNDADSYIQLKNRARWNKL